MKDKKEKIVLFRITKQDWEKFLESTNEENKTPSEVLREFVLKYNKKKKD